MAIFKCKMCGGKLEITEETSVCECEYCGSKQTVSTIDDEKIIKLYDRANRLRMANEFDKAAGVYESIIAESDTEAEAYWGLLLCKFGIEYVDDPATGDKVPTCHRSSFDSIMEDSDLELVMENADAISRNVYREQAKQIEEIRKGILEVSSKEEPYDIFICYKETAEDGDRTIDSVIAQDVYDALTDKGYRVFFSRITLEDKLGKEYEPYIFAALNSAKVMLAFGTSYDYYNAVWVKNEWSRYIKLMAKDKKKTLIPCYKDIDAYDMPSEFKHLQSQDMGKVGAIQDLLRGIDKIIKPVSEASKNNPSEIDINAAIASAMAANSGSNVAALLERGYITLEDGDFTKADGFFEDVLNQNPKCAEAYLGKMLVKYNHKNLEDFKNADIIVDLDKDSDFKHAMQFSIGDDRDELQKVYNKFEKKTQIRYFMQVIKKYSKNKEKEEILVTKENEKKQLEEEKLRKREANRIEQVRKYAFDTAVAKIKEDIRVEISEAKKSIMEETKTKKEPINIEMDAKIREATLEINKYKEQKNNLEHQRESLGIFKGKQKTELTNQIDMLISKINSLPTEESIRNEYQIKYNLIDIDARDKFSEIEKEINAKYTMPKQEDITISILPENPIEKVELGSYKGSPISWIVLEKKDGKALLLSEYALDAMPYNEEFVDTTWAQCTLRSWLNNDFLNEALGTEKNRICTTKVTADANLECSTNPDIDTYDKIFLLSKNEFEKYLSEIGRRMCYPTEYAKTTKLRVEDYKDSIFYGACTWWLRSPGNDIVRISEINRSTAACVAVHGLIAFCGSLAYDKGVAVRPALWLNLDRP